MLQSLKLHDIPHNIKTIEFKSPNEHSVHNIKPTVYDIVSKPTLNNIVYAHFFNMYYHLRHNAGYTINLTNWHGQITGTFPAIFSIISQEYAAFLLQEYVFATLNTGISAGNNIYCHPLKIIDLLIAHEVSSQNQNLAAMPSTFEISPLAFAMTTKGIFAEIFNNSFAKQKKINVLRIDYHVHESPHHTLPGFETITLEDLTNSQVGEYLFPIILHYGSEAKLILGTIYEKTQKASKLFALKRLRTLHLKLINGFVPFSKTFKHLANPQIDFYKKKTNIYPQKRSTWSQASIALNPSAAMAIQLNNAKKIADQKLETLLNNHKLKTEYVNKLQLKINELLKELDIIQNMINQINDKKKEILLQLKNKIESLDSSTNLTTDLVKELKLLANKLNIKITNIQTGYTSIEGANIPYLQKIEFNTLDYINIYPVISSYPTIMGGPYHVSITFHHNGSFQTTVSSCSENNIYPIYAIVEDDDLYMLIHPHVGKTLIKSHYENLNAVTSHLSTKNNAFNTAHNVCLGEAEALIKEAWQKHKPTDIISAAYAWLNSYNPHDPAGQSGLAFPIKE